MTFKIDRTKLNPKFDGYKLASLDEANTVRRIPLPANGISQATVSASSYLFFQEVQARIKFNHLAVGSDSDTYATLGYIDKDGTFTVVRLDKISLQVDFHRLFEIPQAVQPSSPDKEYPTAISVSIDIWVISDGAGRIYVLQTTIPLTSATLLSTSEILKGNSLVPCRLHAALLQEDFIILLLSSRGELTRAGSKTSLSFDLSAFRILLQSQKSTQAELLWRKKGSDIPSYVHHRAGNFLVCAGSTFSDPEPQSTSIDVQQHDITKAIESTDVVAKEKQPTTKPPPYSWTQSSDSVTIAFPLPSNTLKSHIHVTIAPKHLSILIKDLLDINSDSDEADEPPKETFPLPRYAMKELWEYVDVVNSLWTWDKEGGRTVGLLTLHLEKRHEGVKWAHVFSREGTSENDPEVPETVDPSELANIREALEKYTSELQEGTAGSLPSLAQGEMDPSVDTEVGRRSTVSAFDVMTGDEVAPNTAFAEVLSFPLPVDATRAVGIVSEVNTYSLTIKSGIDGPLFAGPVLPNVDAWEHVSTFPAMGFVLASKRDKKFIFHIGRRAVVALESGGRDVAPNMYIYHDAMGKPQGRQGVVRVGGDGTVGALVGIAGVAIRDGIMLVCLREKELVFVKDFL